MKMVDFSFQFGYNFIVILTILSSIFIVIFPSKKEFTVN